MKEQVLEKLKKIKSKIINENTLKFLNQNIEISLKFFKTIILRRLTTMKIEAKRINIVSTSLKRVT